MSERKHPVRNDFSKGLQLGALNSTLYIKDHRRDHWLTGTIQPIVKDYWSMVVGVLAW